MRTDDRLKKLTASGEAAPSEEDMVCVPPHVKQSPQKKTSPKSPLQRLVTLLSERVGFTVTSAQANEYAIKQAVESLEKSNEVKHATS